MLAFIFLRYGLTISKKSHSSACIEIDKVFLYDLLAAALEGGSLELALQPHEKTKDDMRVIKEMYTQHGGRSK